MTGQVDKVLLKPKMSAWNLLFCLQSNNIQVAVIEEKMTFNFLLKNTQVKIRLYWYLTGEIIWLQQLTSCRHRWKKQWFSHRLEK